MIYEYSNRTTWGDFIKAMRSGQTVEIDRETFDYFLDVLPPTGMPWNAVFPDNTERKCSFGFAEGAEEVCAFWGEGKGDDRRYFCRRTIQMNPYAYG